MPDESITDLGELAESPASGDFFVVVDVSDTSMAPTGTDKKVKASHVLGGAVDSVNTQTGTVVLDATDVGADASGAAAAAQAASQPLDSDLTAIAALTTTSYGRALLALADAAAGRTAFGLGTAATQATGAFDAAGAAAAAQAASQPLDSDLTAIAALTTTSYGRAFLALADAAAARTALSLGTAATAASTDFQPVDSDLTAIAALTTTSYGRAFLALANAAAGISALGLDADLATFALPASTTISAFGASLIDDAAASNARTTLGLGTAAVSNTGDFDASGAAAAAQAASQPLDSDLTAIAALTTTSFGRGLLALANAAALVSSAGLDADLATFSLPASTTISAYGATLVDDADAATARTTIGLGSVDNTSDATKNAAVATLTNKSIDASQLTGSVALARLPTGTNGTSVIVGGVITAGGPTGDASHTLALTYNAAGQLTAVTNNAIAIAESQVTNLTTDLAAKQPLDSDLTTIAGLTATTDNMIQSVGSAWASRTPTQVKAALAITEADVANLATDLAVLQRVRRITARTMFR